MNKNLLWASTSLLFFFVPAVRGFSQDDLATQAVLILEKHCHACHGQNRSSEGEFDSVLDLQSLIDDKLIVPTRPDESMVFQRMGIDRDMPPANVDLRPSDHEIQVIRDWITQGAVKPKLSAEPIRPFLSIEDELAAIESYLRSLPDDDWPFIRFFSLRHLYNLPLEQVREKDLRLYRAALAKLLNSLSWQREIVLPQPVDDSQTVFAVDTRELGWAEHKLWKRILKDYPYGLHHQNYPGRPGLRRIAVSMLQMTGSMVPSVRADWFIARASRPPLYNEMLRLPQTDRELEAFLRIDVENNILRGRVLRAGFNGSSVSGHNRLIERHDTAFGAYWKSYDFSSSAGRKNLFVFPLGPNFDGNSYSRHGFVHDGGEIIFNLPNGLQGYLLTDAKGRVIDKGPIEIVRDLKEISGTPQVVNGVSCMACHEHGMITPRYGDQISEGHILGGDAARKLAEIYPGTEILELSLGRDTERFMEALQTATGKFLQIGENSDTPIESFPEPIGKIAHWYFRSEIDLTIAASELGISDPKNLIDAIEHDISLQEAGLFPLSRGGTLKRESWEHKGFLASPYQKAARVLRLGTPFHVVN